MLEDLFCAAIAVFAVWGVMALVYVFLTSLIRPPRGAPCVVLLYLNEPPEAAVERVSFYLSRLSLTGSLGRTVIAAVHEDGDAALSEALNSAFGGDAHVLICCKSYFMAHFPL